MIKLRYFFTSVLGAYSKLIGKDYSMHIARGENEKDAGVLATSNEMARYGRYKTSDDLLPLRACLQYLTIYLSLIHI